MAFMESVALVSDIDSMEDDKDTVTLITLHQAKGLEFPVVFIVGMEEGILPHIKSIESGDPLELEEERRLFYVGMTRAKEKLYLSRASLRGFYGSSEPTLPSRFIGDIPAELFSLIAHWRETLAEDQVAVLEAVNLFEGEYMGRIDVGWLTAVSYTHLTLPTNREV